ncbi:hypothetical protein E5288_WYG022658 [Bos mutus]|uniref:Uncharacterized protein n=1 Tax=Bos mutus TaxID=72004 RepID=A0A6B0R1D3_9CETA|nr:hypothetical protein [Bos mutus]
MHSPTGTWKPPPCGGAQAIVTPRARPSSLRSGRVEVPPPGCHRPLHSKGLLEELWHTFAGENVLGLGPRQHCANLQRIAKIRNIIKWGKIKMFCCHMLSHTVRKPCAAATVELNPIKRSANKADFGVFDPISLPVDKPDDILERKQQIHVFGFLFSNTVPCCEDGD